MATRPQRSTRGKRAKPSEEENKKEEALYNQYFGHDSEDSGEDFTERSKSITEMRSQMLKKNIFGFPYARSHHYYYDLSRLPRAGTPSYAEDTRVSIEQQHFNDSQLLQLYRQKGYDAQNIINRKYITLPIRQPSVGQSVHGDKNPCHQYLFKNQDRKIRVDQLLCQLRCLKRKPNLLQTNAAKSFLLIRKDPELSALYDVNVPLPNKQLLLDESIKKLEDRRQSKKAQLQFQDWLFFHTSLNQKFFNKHSMSELEPYNIMLEGVFLFNLGKEIPTAEVNQERNRKISFFFSVYGTIGMNHSVLDDIMNDFITNFINTKTPPSYILNFNSKENLNRVQRILSMRVFNTGGQPAFYQLRAFWRKLFNKDISFEEQYVAKKAQDYVSQISKAIVKYQTTATKATQALNGDIQMPEPGTTELFMGSTAAIKITIEQFVLLYLLYAIYQRVGFFNMDDKLIGQESFQRYHFKIAQLIGLPFSATFEPAIKLFSNILVSGLANYFLERLRPQPHFPCDIHMEMTAANMCLVWLTQQEVWQTQQQEQPQGSGSQQVPILPTEPQPQSLEQSDIPRKRMKECDQ